MEIVLQKYLKKISKGYKTQTILSMISSSMTIITFSLPYIIETSVIVHAFSLCILIVLCTFFTLYILLEVILKTNATNCTLIEGEQLLNENNRLISSCKNVNNSRYYMNSPVNSPCESEKILFSVRIKKLNPNKPTKSFFKKHNMMSLIGKMSMIKSSSLKLKFNLEKNRPNITSSTCSTVKKSVL